MRELPTPLSTMGTLDIFEKMTLEPALVRLPWHPLPLADGKIDFIAPTINMCTYSNIHGKLFCFTKDRETITFLSLFHLSLLSIHLSINLSIFLSFSVFIFFVIGSETVRPRPSVVRILCHKSYKVGKLHFLCSLFAPKSFRNQSSDKVFGERWLCSILVVFLDLKLR